MGLDASGYGKILTTIWKLRELFVVNELTAESITYEIESRRVLISQMIGTLYPSILCDEIHELNAMLMSERTDYAMFMSERTDV